MIRIGFLGAGRMAQALIAGLIRSGFPPEEIAVTSRTPERRREVAHRFGVVALDGREELSSAEVILLAVKPQQLEEAVAPLSGTASLVVSLAAGIPVALLRRWLPRADLVRAMPNTPVRVGAGVAGLYATRELPPEKRACAEALFRRVGEVVWLEEEGLLDAVTALSGSGPAYLFYLMEQLEKVGAELGLKPEVARRLACWTVYGAGKLAVEEGRAPEELRREVTSPGGTTERALERLEEAGVGRHLQEAVLAAWRRARELARSLS